MPRPSLPVGRPNSPVIHPQALDLHRRFSSTDEAMPYRVTIRDRDQVDELNTTTAEYDTDPGFVHYFDEPARLHPVPLNEQKVTIVDQSEQTSRWYMRVRLGVQVLQNQLVDVTAADERYADPTLVGRTFRILDDTPRVFGTELRVTVQEEPVPRSTGT